MGKPVYGFNLNHNSNYLFKSLFIFGHMKTLRLNTNQRASLTVCWAWELPYVVFIFPPATHTGNGHHIYRWIRVKISSVFFLTSVPFKNWESGQIWCKNASFPTGGQCQCFMWMHTWMWLHVEVIALGASCCTHEREEGYVCLGPPCWSCSALNSIPHSTGDHIPSLTQDSSRKSLWVPHAQRKCHIFLDRVMCFSWTQTCVYKLISTLLSIFLSLCAY